MAKNKKKFAARPHRISPSHLGQVPPMAAATSQLAHGGGKNTSSIVAIDTTLIGPEVRRVLLLAGLFIAAELILWGLFTQTGLGTAVYSWVKL